MSGDYETYEWNDTPWGRFRIESQRSGTWTSYSEDGKGIVTCYSREVCIEVTRFHLEGVATDWSTSGIADETMGEKR